MVGKVTTPLVILKDAYFKAIGSSKYIFPEALNLTIEPNSRWAIVGPGKTKLLSIIAAKHIAEPPDSRTYPFLESKVWPTTVIRDMSFRGSIPKHYLAARYESLREDGDQTVGEYLAQGMSHEGTSTCQLLESIIKRFALEGLKDRWNVSLSNGQTRRARLAKAVLKKPRILVIDEPFLGLDPDAVHLVSHVLSQLPPDPYVVLGLRYQDPLPDWITHVAVVDANGITAHGPKENIRVKIEEMRQKRDKKISHAAGSQHHAAPPIKDSAKPIIEFNDVTVAYKGRPVLKDLKWKVLEGEKWHLRGRNGSGKSTLLSLLTADHPQAWSNSISLENEPREVGKHNYFSINKIIGHASPEIHGLFPKRLSARRAVATGYVVGTFVPPKLSPHQEEHVVDLLSDFNIDPDTPFGDLSLSDQKAVLFLRAIVNSPKILILDEAMSAMDEEQIEKVKDFIRRWPGTVIAVGHVDQELPHCTKYLQLRDPGEHDIGEIVSVS